MLQAMPTFCLEAPVTIDSLVQNLLTISSEDQAMISSKEVEVQISFTEKKETTIYPLEQTRIQTAMHPITKFGEVLAMTT